MDFYLSQRKAEAGPDLCNSELVLRTDQRQMHTQMVTHRINFSSSSSNIPVNVDYKSSYLEKQKTGTKYFSKMPKCPPNIHTNPVKLM